MDDVEYYKIVKSALKFYRFNYDEDIVQEIVTFLYTKLKNYDETKAELTTYAYAVVKNKYIQIKQEEKKYTCISLDKEIKENITLLDTIADEREFERIFYQKEIYNFLKPYIELPLALWLEGKTQREIATKLGIKHQALVCNKIKDNLLKLKQICKENGIGLENGKIRK